MILLLSGSYVYGSGYLYHYEKVIREFFSGIDEVVFVPYAADEKNWDQYTSTVKERFGEFGINVTGIHEDRNKNDLQQSDKAIFIGGGNTFRLLYQLQKFDLLSKIKQSVIHNGLRYMGSSAGSNVACHTICTTNDMPIIFPEKGFSAIDLLPFQMNPHYIDPAVNSTHMGETRDDRIREFHDRHTTPVIGLREGAYLLVNDSYSNDEKIYLGGTNGAKFFFKNSEPIDLVSPCSFKLGDDGIERF